MMKNNKVASLAITGLLLLSMLTILCSPITQGGEFKDTGNNFYGKLTPEVVSGAYPYPQVRFQFNITCNVTAPDFINKTVLTWPSGWTYVRGENSTDWGVTARTGTTVTFENKTAAGALTKGEWVLLNVTMAVTRSGSQSWTIACYEGATARGTATKSVYVTPWFEAKITPTLVKKDQSLWFEITVKNNASTPSIFQVNVTYPTTHGWTFQDVTAPTGWIIEAHAAGKITFKATGGYEIAKGSSAVFKVKMLTGGVADSTNDYSWTVDVKNTAYATDTMTLPVKSDNTKPTITVTAPAVSYYSVGSGNYMWLNITVHDDVNAKPVVVLNDTRFSLYSETVTGSYDFKFYYRNNTKISDGPLAIQINVTDYIGNKATEYPKVVSTIVDNTPPFIWIKVTPATPVGSTFWIGKTTASVTVNVTVADYALEPIGPLTGIYINGTRQTWTFSLTPKKYKGYPVWECVNSLTTPTDKRRWVVFVNVTDTARPKNHTSQMTVYIERDLVPPYEIGFTTVKPICGGLIIYGLYAKDTVGIGDFRIYLNGTNIANVTYTDLIATTWKPGAGYGSFSGVAVLDLTSYVGKYVNITASARDYGLNEGSKIVVFTGKVPSGLWAPIVLRAGWNLISLPLIPNSTATADIYSLILKQKAAGVLATYGFNNEVKTWILDPTTMTDGNAYWINVKAYDVLIVHGRPTPRPPALPTTYHLYKGWNFAGFTETKTMNAGDYLASLEPGSYFRYIYVWDAVNQEWKMVDTKTPSTLPTNLEVGQGFLIYMYKEQDLIPPIDP